MKIRFSNSETALGFSIGLGCYDEFDLVARADGTVVDISGIGADGPIGRQVTEAALGCGGSVVDDRE